MVVNSYIFAWFFAIVFAGYYFLFKGKAQWQNLWLLIASYYSYAIVDCQMTLLLLVCTILYFYLGRCIDRYNQTSEKKASLLTNVGVCLGVGMLLYFKYLNFFIESVANYLSALGFNANIHMLNILMPLGISFFTFKLIAYIVEIHREHIKASTDMVAFGTYIAFFPTIMSGPIDRPKPFLKQLTAYRAFNYEMAIDGLRQIIWGMSKKIIIADALSSYLDKDISTTSGSTLLVVAIFYLLQMYADFSGYSDMAIGTAKILGINIAKNFKYPLFARNIAEYWRNWHMSLTAWLSDYVFAPLNIRFRNWGLYGMSLAIIINLVVIGMWHGPKWSYAVFGLYHGLLYIPLIFSGAFLKKEKLIENRFGLPQLKDFGRMVGTFMLVVFGLIIFRFEDLEVSWNYILKILSPSFFSAPQWPSLITILFIVVMIVAEWIQRKKEYALDLRNVQSAAVRVAICSVLVVLMLVFYTKVETFIYFKF